VRAILLALGFALACDAAWAVQDTRWPPPQRVLQRMHELEAVIRDPQSTLAQREAAREELGELMKSPAGRAAPPPPRKLPPRAAIQPYPSVVQPLPPIEKAVPAPAGVAHLEIVEPPRAPVVNPQTGSVAVPTGKIAIDPATGHVLHEVPGGYVDPRTGQFIPR
jgi:hypothetical protein